MKVSFKVTPKLAPITSTINFLLGTVRTCLDVELLILEPMNLTVLPCLSVFDFVEECI